MQAPRPQTGMRRSMGSQRRPLLCLQHDRAMPPCETRLCCCHLGLHRLKLRADQPKATGLFPVLSHSSFALLLSLVLLTPFIQMSGALTDDEKTFRLYGYGILLAIQGTLVFLRGWQKSLRIFASPALLALIWFGLSLTWAEHAGIAFRRVALLWLVYASALSGVGDLGYRRSLGILTLLLLIALTVNYAVVFAFPDLGTQHWRDITQWRGFMAHKNIAGMTCAVTILTLAFYDDKRILAARLIGSLAALAFLYCTGSRTAMLALLIAAPIGVCFDRGRRPGNEVRDGHEKIFTLAALVSLALGLAILVILTVQREALIAMTDNARAVALRSSIWRPMIQYYLDHPVLGSGYGAYWTPSGSVISAREFGTQEWLKDVDQGHNGYLDLLVQTGVPGLALALYAVLVWPVSRLGAILTIKPERAALIYSLIAFFLVENATESSLFADDTLGNAFLLFALANVRRFDLGAQNRRERRGPGRGQGQPELI